MKDTSILSRRRLLKHGATLAPMGLVGLTPRDGSASDRPVSDPNTSPAEQWEDMLLLEALRYLRLTSEQLQQLLPVVNAAHEKFAKLRQAEEGTLKEMGRLAAMQREALVAGRGSSANEQRTALKLAQSAQHQRTRTEEQIIDLALPRLHRLLTSQQLQAAHRLVHGELFGEVVSSALVDPSAGFVLASRPPSARVRLFEAERRLADARVEHQQPRERSERDLEGLKALHADLEADVQRARQEMAQAPPATDGDLLTALRQIVRRMFLSSRLKTLVTECAQRVR
jgi:cell division septum initiation protein DivIVA